MEKPKFSIEKRAFESPVTLSPDEGSRKVEGYAALFDVESSDLYGMTETIERGAFDGVIQRSDVLCLMNHDDRRGALARSTNGEGSLSLEVDDKGLKYSFEAPHSTLGDELLESLKRGDIRASSFAFTVKEEEWKDEGETLRRKVIKIDELYDVSPVFRPAYEDTTVYARGKQITAVPDKAAELQITKELDNLKSEIL